MQKWKNVGYFHELEVTRELTKVAAASIVYCVHKALLSQQISS